MNMTLLLDPDWWFYTRIHSNTVHAYTFTKYTPHEHTYNHWNVCMCNMYKHIQSLARTQANTYPLLTAFLSIKIICLQSSIETYKYTHTDIHSPPGYAIWK